MNNINNIIAGGMVHQLNKLDVISNNIANVNTTGFKQKNLTEESFSSFRSEYPLGKDLNFEENTQEAADLINNTLNMIPRSGEKFTDSSLGMFVKTDNMLDFSLNDKNDYFLIQDQKNNDMFLTRSGNFSVDKNGMLVTKNGMLVLNNQLKPLNATETDFQKDIGVISRDINTLKNKGGNMYSDNSLYNVSISELKTISAEDVVSGVLEKSNVNTISEMAKMIETQRIFENLQKISKGIQEMGQQSSRLI